MELDAEGFPKSFDPKRCVLFLGAGFSAEAISKNGKNPPIGAGLGREIKKLCGLPDDDSSELADLAGYAIDERKDVYSLLEEFYTIKTITEDQEKILSQPWLRIYTTNYDNSVSVYRAGRGMSPTDNIYDLTDDVPRKVRPGAVIHLHGSIARCGVDTVDQSLVLSKRSYVEQRVVGSGWWDWFGKDLRVCQFIFLLGYDLNDFEPASYLFKYPDAVKSRHFILRKPAGPVGAAKLRDYGVRHSFELSGFVSKLARAKVSPTPKNAHEINSFRFIDLNKDSKLPAKPSTAEIAELLAFGKVRFGALAVTFPASTYVVNRADQLKKCQNELKNNRILIIHSKIGNGKSIISETLKVELSRNGHMCFELKPNIVPQSQDIEYLSSLDAPCVFFPSYDNAVENMHLFDGLKEGARFVVEINSSTLNVRFDEVNRKLAGSKGRVAVDRFTLDEVEALRNLLTGAGLTKLAGIEGIKPGMEFREFLLEAFDDPEIAKRLGAAIDRLMTSSGIRKVVGALSILKACGQSADPGFIEDALGQDPYEALFSQREFALDFMKLDMYEIEMHSSVLSEFMLKRTFESDDVSEIVFKLAYEAARRKEMETDFGSDRFRNARSILSSVLRFGFLQDIFIDRKLIEKLYEKCRDSERIRREPLFWLQYSIYWHDLSRLDLAESHMTEAYEMAALLPDFRTFQLDTHFLGLLCELELDSEAGMPLKRFDTLLNLTESCYPMLNNGNHRFHALKAFMKFERLLKKRATDLSNEQKLKLDLVLKLAVSRLTSLPPEHKATWGTEDCRKSLEAGLAYLEA